MTISFYSQNGKIELKNFIHKTQYNHLLLRDRNNVYGGRGEFLEMSL